MTIDEITVRFVAEGSEGVGALRDVSRQGLFVHARDIPRQGAIVALQFEGPTGKLVDLRGEVRWSARDSDGFGVRLHEPPKEYRDFVGWALSLEDVGDDAEASESGDAGDPEIP